MAYIRSYIHSCLRNVITYRCANLDGALAKPSFKLGYGWIITPCRFSLLHLFIHALNFWLVNMSWWRHQMETFSALLAICAGNSPVTGEFPTQRPVMRSFDVFFDLHPNERLSKQWWGWWFETLSSPLWRPHNVFVDIPQGSWEYEPHERYITQDKPFMWITP